MEPFLTLEKVGFRYGDHWALQGIDLRLAPGELVGVLGPNGSGKSTLLKVMDGILQPQRGAIRLLGKPLRQYRRRALARAVAFVPQETVFHFTFSVLEVVMMARTPHLRRLAFEQAADLAVVEDALDQMQVRHLVRRSIHDLSGGEKQRVLIARALAQQPSVILLDEPTSFSDIRFKREIFELIAAMTRRRQLGVVVVTHDIDLAALYCDRLLLLKAGTLAAAGTPQQVITAANVRQVFDAPVVVDRNPATGTPRVSLVRGDLESAGSAVK